MNGQANLYLALAQALAEPPGWLAAPGRDWPLFEAAVYAAQAGSSAAAQAVDRLARIPAESLPARRRRYEQFFAGPGRPRIWLYESWYVDGRLLGPAALAVEQVYRAAGLDVAETELPDHASVELAFLGWLARQAAAEPAQAVQWQTLARRFISRHAGRWLPSLGRILANTGDPVYAPVGKLLAGWLAEAVVSPQQRAQAARRIPAVSRPELCSLCGFCVQVCPTHALHIRETDTETGLVLNPAACIACGKCERTCYAAALRLAAQPDAPTGPAVLRVSPRSVCPGCGQPTVSRAELEAVAAGMGRYPAWLDYCLNCRSGLMERIQ